jgi:hypothetical protein
MAGVIAAAAITAGATLVGGMASSRAAGRAASTQADAANQAAALQAQSTADQIALQREIFGQQRADIAPFRQAGLTAQNQLLTYLGLNPATTNMAPPTTFDEAGYNRAMEAYNAQQQQQQQQTVSNQGTFTPGYWQDSGQESGAPVYIEPTFTPGPAAAAGAGGAGGAGGAAVPMPTREQFTTTMPVDQLQVNTGSRDFGRYARDFVPSAQTRLPGAFTAGAEAALPAAFTPGAEAALPEAFTGQVDLQADPGYQFRLSEGLKALDRQAAARGGLISGSALKASQRYGQDMASQEYGQAYARALTQYGAGVDRANTMYGRDLTGYGSQVDRANTMYGRDLTTYGSEVDRANTMLGREFDIFQANRANALNPLLSLSGSGQLATNTLGGYGSQFASGAGSAMQTGAANIGNALGAAGQARASGYVGQSNALNATLGNISNIAGQYFAGQNNNPYGRTGSPSIYGTGPITRSTNYFGE